MPADRLGNQAPFWLLLFGLAAFSAGFYGLLEGSVQTPSAFLLSGRIERASQPAAYWLLTLAYLAAGAMFLLLAWRRRHEPAFEGEAEMPRAPQPGWARALAWTGVVFGALLLGAGIWAHFAIEPIISLFFVALFGGGGLCLLLAGAGYLVTGRLQ